MLQELLASTVPAKPEEKQDCVDKDDCTHKTEKSPSNDDLENKFNYLRLSIKYLVFDLEATRRETASLRKILKEIKGGDK